MQFDQAFFAKALKGAMEARGWRRQQVGEFFGVDRSNVSQWVNCKRIPDEDHMAKFAELTGITLEDLRLIRQAIHLEAKGINLTKLSGKGIVLSDDERLVVQMMRGGKDIEAAEYLLRRARGSKTGS